MYCSQCGSELPDSASFCNQCGAPLPGNAAEAEASEQPAAASGTAENASAAEAAQAQPSTQPQTQPAPDVQPGKPKRKGLVIGIIAAVAVIVIAAVVLLVVLPNLGSKTAAVTFSVQNEGFQNSSSPIPVRIEGTDAEGNAVSGLFGVDPATMTLNLPEGSFAIAPAGNIVNPDGSILRTMYREAVEVVVAPEGDSFGAGMIALIDGEEKPISFTYETVSLDKVTWEDIDNVQSWTSEMAEESAEGAKVESPIKGGTEPANAPAYYDGLTNAVDSYYHVVTESFEFDIPEYWWGKVHWEIHEGESDININNQEPLISSVKVFATPDPANNLDADAELATVCSSVGALSVNVPDLYSIPGDPVEDNGIFVQAFVTNWTVGMDPVNPATPYLCDLQTEGKGTVPEWSYNASDETRQAIRDLTGKLLSSVNITLSDEQAYALCKAHYHVSTDYYEFDIPEYWWGKVQWMTSTYTSQPYWSTYKTPKTTTEVYIYVDSVKTTLMHVDSYTTTSSQDADVWVGSYGSIPLQEYNVDGRRTRITTLNAGIYPLTVQGGGNASNSVIEACDLVTGGKSKELNPAVNDKDEYEAATRAFFETEFMPSFSLK